MNNKFKPAFTLIELIVVISIIGILSVVVISAINPIQQQKKARDAVRKGDLAKVTTALEQYYADHNSYPVYVDGDLPASDLAAYLNNGVPVDPLADYRYCYKSKSTDNYQSYVVCSLSEASGDNTSGLTLNCSPQKDVSPTTFVRYCVSNPF